jgi:hypothetical protein
VALALHFHDAGVTAAELRELNVKRRCRAVVEISLE